MACKIMEDDKMTEKTEGPNVLSAGAGIYRLIVPCVAKDCQAI